MRFKVSDTINITTCRSDYQRCVACNKKMGKGTLGISMNNSSDGLAIGKNLWLHIGCQTKLATKLSRYWKKHQKEIVAEALL